MKNKKVEKLVYSLMTLIVFMQSFVPILAVAETKDEGTAPITIKTAELSKNDDASVNLKLEGEVTNNGETTIEDSLSIVEGTSFVPKDPQPLGVGESTYTTSSDKLTFHVSAKSSGTFSITASIAAETMGQTMTIKLNDQTIPVTIPSEVTESSVSESTNETQSTDQTQSSTAESTTEGQTDNSETSQSSEQTESSSQKTNETTDKIKEQQPKAATGTDIRTYFPNGQGTIIDNADVTYYDKNGNQLQQPVPADAEVRVHYDWSIPEEVRQQIQPGDQFTFMLPTGVKPIAGQTGELKDANGEVYGTYEMDANGQVVMTFNDNVTKETDIKGTFDFSTKFDEVHIDGPGDHQITFPTEDKIPPVEVTVKPATDTSIAKSGHFDRTPNPTEVTWAVDFNQAMNELENPTITEKWPAGLSYQSVKVYKLEMNLDGTIEKVGQELSPSDYTVDANGNVTINGETSDAYRVEYVTSIDEDAIPDQGGKVTFVNTATLTDEADPDGLDAKASVTNTFGKMVEKNQVGYDPDKQEFSWEINYNYGEKTIAQKDAVITDTMSSNMTLSGDPVIYPVAYGPKGEEIKGSTPLVEGTDYKLVKNPNGDGFVIEFLQDVTSAYKIEYKSKVEGIITDPTAIDNKVEVGTGETGNGSGTAEQQNVIKYLDKNSIDYQNKTIDWIIQVNRNHYDMYDLVLTDTFSPVPGLELVKTPDLSGYELTVTSSSGKTLQQGVDYSIVPTLNSQNQQTGYELKFLGSYNPTNEAFTIKYTTSFNSVLIDPDDPSLDHFTNDISADWLSANEDKHHSEDKGEFKPDSSFSLNAQKSGAYNAQTKIITWSIAVNLSGNILNNAFLTDKILDNQKYVTGSLNVYEAHTNSNGTVVKDDNTPDNRSMKSVTEPTAANGHTFDIRFPDQSQHTYIVEFETSLVGQVIDESKEYDNHATYSNDGRDRDVLGKVTVNNGGSHVQKSGEQDKNHPDYVNWHVTINPAQSVLKNVVVTDKPSNNQIVDEQSIQLYETTVAVDGTITPDKSKPLVQGVDYSLSMTTDNVTGDQVIEVRFLHEISTAYYMEYRALINSSSTGNKDKLTNEATVTGDGEKTVTDNSGKDITVEVDHSGGTASGKKGSITLQKTNEDQSVFLAGAHFQLWDTTKSQILREGDVDATGKITFGNLQLGEYLLVETTAPAGYTIPDDLVRGRRISITAGTSAETAKPTAIVNEPNKVILTKTGEQEEKLANAEFRLEKQQGLLWIDVTPGPLVTNAQGVLEIDSLPLGHYRLTEIKAPAGYLVNTTPIEFTVTKTDQNQIPTVELSMIDYQGSAVLTKFTSDEYALAGATFKVIDAQGKTIKDNLVSDANGKVYVDGLAPGDYFFVETKAPAGYVLNTKKYPFTITNQAAAKPAEVNAGQAFNYKGSAELIKEDESGKVLAGATFKVVDAKGKTIKDNLVSDANGKISIDELAPGDYSFVETKAPTGYILNTKKIDFTISAASDGKPAVVKAGTITNYQGAITLHKVNTADEFLEGAEFTLYDDQMKELDKVTSGKDGLIQFDHLAPGTYYLVETKAPKLADGTDYVINPYPVKVTIPDKTDNQPVIVDKGEFQNFKGKAEIQKTGKHGSIAGAEFALYVIENGQEKFEKTIVVPATGILPIDNLGAGQYKLVETKAAPGYIINNQPIYFVVDPSIEGTVDHFDFENYESEITGQKIDGDKLTSEGLTGAEFQIYEQNPDGSKGNGPISVRDATGQQTDTITTDSKGALYAAGLSIGNYLLVETKAPAGYVLDTTEHAFEIKEQAGKPDAVDLGSIANYRGKIDITKTNESQTLLEGGTFVLATDKAGKQPVTVIGVDGKETTELHAIKGHIQAQGLAPGTYYLVETKAPDGYIVNTEPIEVVISEKAQELEGLEVEGNLVNYQGAVLLTKENEQGVGLQNAEFKIIDSNGKTVQTGITSDTNGEVKAEGLAPGNYQFIETKAPNGYLLNTAPIDFTINDQVEGKPETVTIKDSFINYKGSVLMTKVDEADKVLAGAEFNIVDTTGKTIQTGIISDVNGEIRAEGLAPGDYQFIETKAPSGYLLNTTPTDFTIKDQAKGKPEVVTIDKHFINYKGSVIMTKVDEKDKALAGAEFKLVDNKGKTVQDKLLSDANGVIKAQGIAPGSYQLIETKAPDTYILNTKAIDFVIKDNYAGKPEVVNISEHFINYRGIAELTKVNEQNEPLQGAEFKVVDHSGKTVKSNLISDKKGKVSVNNLAPGTYQFVEVKAPTGYQISEKTVTFTIDKTAENEPALQNRGDFVNKKIPKPVAPKPTTPKPMNKSKNHLPQTNDQRNTSFVVIGIVVLAAVGIGYFWRKKK